MKIKINKKAISPHSTGDLKSSEEFLLLFGQQYKVLFFLYRFRFLFLLHHFLYCVYLNYC
jgi:hypothetical protein